MIEHNKENVAQELIDLATVSIDDIVYWDDQGNVSVKDPKNIPKAAIKAIKKIKVTPTAGPQLEVELHDKVSVLRTLAKASGLLEQQEDIDKPSVVGIVMHGPEPKIIDGDVTDAEEQTNDTGGDRPSSSGDVKKKLSDEHCARIVGRSTKDWKNIVRKKKSEDSYRIVSMLHSLENYE